jgi:murein DD-endopeptidase MepM/ murein hydrolase activator NlpD
MRWFALTVVAFISAAPAYADDGRLDWPLRPRPSVVRMFDAPSPNWNRGHRGVDLAGTPGQPVYAAGPGAVVFAGELAGRPLVSIAHPGGLRTSYEPVRPSVRAGQLVDAGAVIGALEAGHDGCAVAACLHWGAMWGPASRADYVDPLGLVASTPIRLKPLHRRGAVRERPRLHATRRGFLYKQGRPRLACGPTRPTKTRLPSKP